ncbi:hypothetical protein [Rhizobium oryzicola]|nr:hypothetical protein [Rhizobium oryzicola]
MLSIYVQLQNGYVERASLLCDALRRLGDNSADATLASAVIAFINGHFRDSVAHLDRLDRIDPLERFGNYRLTDRQRMRRYLRLRCLYELEEKARAQDALESYLRHGETNDEGL